MAEPVTLAQIKADLRFGTEPHEDDGLISRLIPAARRALEIKTGRTIVGDVVEVAGADLELACQAISLIVCTWYETPVGVATDTRSTPTEMPLGVSWIITALQRWDDGSE